MPLFRFLRILRVFFRYRLDTFLRPATLSSLPPRGKRLRQALEALGPIFVKLGQMLSTRRDLVPADIADELSLLQDRVPPFPAEQVDRILRGAYGCDTHDIFPVFDPAPVASASVAQVHFAELPDGRPVAVKVLRPRIERTIVRDLALMKMAARWLLFVWKDAQRLRPLEVIGEFEKTLSGELDLLREAANCSQLRHNFSHSPLLRVPEVFWDWCRSQVMVMERMHGIPISDIDALKKAGVDLKVLSRNGVEIFFTQVFRDGFFHADMHPGNILVETTAAGSRYVALDFGIMGALSVRDKTYLARNFAAFFARDYAKVAALHIESNWVPPGTRVDELEAEIRTVCEPIFDRPLKEISFGRILLQLFKASRRFNVEIQPQLVLLEKTMINVEGLGRQLDPDLDLWTTARPFIDRWLREQTGWRAFVNGIVDQAPHWVSLPQWPRLIQERLAATPSASESTPYRQERQRLQRQRNRWLMAIAFLLAAMLAVESALLWKTFF